MHAGFQTSYLPVADWGSSWNLSEIQVELAEAYN